MAYVCVGPDTIKRADDTRQAMMKAAIDFAAGRIEPKEFDRIHMSLAMALCCESGQPAQADHRQYILRRLRNFYPVAIRETVDGFQIEYRHNRLPKRKRVTIPDGLLDERHPFRIGLEDVSGKGWEVDVAELKTSTIIGSGPHHLTVDWGANGIDPGKRMNPSTLPTWAEKVESLESRLESVRLTHDERNALTWADSALMDSIDTALKNDRPDWANRSRESVFVIRRLMKRLA